MAAGGRDFWKIDLDSGLRERGLRAVVSARSACRPLKIKALDERDDFVDVRYVLSSLAWPDVRMNERGVSQVQLGSTETGAGDPQVLRDMSTLRSELSICMTFDRVR